MGQNGPPRALDDAAFGAISIGSTMEPSERARRTSPARSYTPKSCHVIPKLWGIVEINLR